MRCWRPTLSSTGSRRDPNAPLAPVKAMIAFSTAALLAGCATKPIDQREAQSPGYKGGWDDGCESGLYERNVRFYGRPLASDRFTRDDGRFGTDKDYTDGWNDGAKSCAVGRPGPPRRDR
jgi:hypothetical protein